MNWITRELFAGKPEDVKKNLIQDHDTCDCVMENHSKAHIVIYEKDTFGLVGATVLCKECLKETEEEIQQFICNDCNGTFKLSEINRWVPYDYYPPQGDVPLYICDDCYDNERHQRRMNLDEMNEDMEAGFYDY